MRAKAPPASSPRKPAAHAGAARAVHVRLAPSETHEPPSRTSRSARTIRSRCRTTRTRAIAG
ncbi:putative prokaryotic diacylglycerol kinase [Burkholderia thailandensis]|uniref:Prokaryotic diacylglycerol kinase n=1 Tax=Burkholderia thailandensis TaxID=57975 RepID=A0AAW9CXG8_BURTH|nr:putative prokaryotic diacylglycerol kinase [Burkholderia thailandensis]